MNINKTPPSTQGWLKTVWQPSQCAKCCSAGPTPWTGKGRRWSRRGSAEERGELEPRGCQSGGLGSGLLNYCGMCMPKASETVGQRKKQSCGMRALQLANKTVQASHKYCEYSLKFNGPLVPVGILFQDSLQVLKSADTGTSGGPAWHCCYSPGGHAWSSRDCVGLPASSEGLLHMARSHFRFSLATSGRDLKVF